MSIAKLFPSGAIEIVDIIDNQLVRRVYYGHTRREAVKMFKAENVKPKQR